MRHVARSGQRPALSPRDRFGELRPVLIARRVVYGTQGTPVEWTLGTYRADRYRATYRTDTAPPAATGSTPGAA